jgi:hypothetical protein
MKFVKNNYLFVIEFNSDQLDNIVTPTNPNEYILNDYKGNISVCATNIINHFKYHGVVKVTNAAVNYQIKNNFHTDCVKYIWPKLEKDKLSIRFIFDNNNNIEYWIFGK